MYKILFTLTTLIMASLSAICQPDINWASELIEYTDRFQFENNSTAMVLGAPAMYPSSSWEQAHDPYSEGYILNKENKIFQKNTIKVGFKKPVSGKQVVLGGVFNIGSIYSVSIYGADNKEKIVYTLDKKPSSTKFTTFSVYFPTTTVQAVKVVIDHGNISGWNIMKGIGITADDKPVDLKPSLSDELIFADKQKIGDNISTKECFEFNPKLTPDGNTLYFVKECENEPDQEIWVTQLKADGTWNEPKNIGAPLNNKGHNFVASISSDNKFMVVGNTYNPDGSDAGDGVSISYANADGTWQVPQPLKIPQYENLNDHANFFLSDDADILLMAIQDRSSLGDLDLYASFYNQNEKRWSPPINLGSQINTPFSEDYPYLSADGTTLFFSSKGYLGYGAHDIYMSKRLDDSWKNWSKPINLGPAVNSKADDKGFTISSVSNRAYFNSVNFDTDLHHMDIYQVKIPQSLVRKP
ncbi:MAG: hypothetical protein NW207_00725 [Cytophagales bacterium]|nr:hypothetical protein [Cytophagales bacterium]